MGISLTLAELKEYFITWHKNNFPSLHKEGVFELIDEYLDANNLLSQINLTSSITRKIVTIAQILSQVIDGHTNLSQDSSLDNVASELSNKVSNFNFLKHNLTQLLIDIENYNGALSRKTDKTYVDNEITKVKNLVGITPKQLQVQDIPLEPVTDNTKNLNNYKTPGLYRSKSAENTGSLTNVPDGAKNTAFSLMVIPHLDNSVKQILLSGDSTAEGNRIYMRNYVNSKNWSSWYELYGEHNLSPLQMKIEWSDGSTPTIYTLLQK